jgi:hypothetical protein
MNISQAFSKLNNILCESAATDELRQTLADIDQLDADIKTLQKEKSDGWDKDFKHRLDDSWDEVRRISQELHSILAEYRKKRYTEWDQDGDPTDFEILENEKVKKEVAMLEATIRARLAQVESDYAKLLTQVQNDHESAFSSHSQQITTKSASRDAAHQRKDTLWKTVAEESQAELSKLLAKCQKQVQITPQWDKMKIKDRTLILSIIMPAGCLYIDDDYLDQDWEETTIKSNKVYDDIYEAVYEDGHFTKFADSLGIPGAFVDAAEAGDLLSIPGSDWKLDYDVDLEYKEPEIRSEHYTPATRWEPAEWDIEYDEEVDYSIIFYLIKDI